MRAGGLVTVAKVPMLVELDADRAVWELSNVRLDFSQTNDQAAKSPEKLLRLRDLWRIEAARFACATKIEKVTVALKAK